MSQSLSPSAPEPATAPVSSQELIVTISDPSSQPSPHVLARTQARFRESFKAIDYLDLYRHIPYYIVLMMGAYIAFFFLEKDYAYNLQPIYLDSEHPKELWRTYTYSLVHADTAHLTNNCILFFTLGCILNVAHGNLRIALLNTLGSIGGAIAVGFEWRYRMDHAPSEFTLYVWRVVGASGGIYSLIGAHAGNLSINWAEMPFRYLHLMMLLVMILTDVLLYVYEYNEFISYSAHAGGFLTGALLGPLLLINVKERKWEKYLQITCGALSIGYAIAGLINFLVL
jgi:membrane associated rhomboid family serine protease